MSLSFSRNVPCTPSKKVKSLWTSGAQKSWSELCTKQTEQSNFSPDVGFSSVTLAADHLWTHPIGCASDRTDAGPRHADCLQPFAGPKVPKLHIASRVPENIGSWEGGRKEGDGEGEEEGSNSDSKSVTNSTLQGISSQYMKRGAKKRKRDQVEGTGSSHVGISYPLYPYVQSCCCEGSRLLQESAECTSGSHFPSVHHRPSAGLWQNPSQEKQERYWRGLQQQGNNLANPLQVRSRRQSLSRGLAQFLPLACTPWICSGSSLLGPSSTHNTGQCAHAEGSSTAEFHTPKHSLPAGMKRAS